MAKLSNVFKKEAQDFIREVNTKEVLKTLKYLDNCEEIPENVQEFLDANPLPRVDSVSFVSFEYITMLKDATFYGDVKATSCFGCTLQKENSVFPVLFIYEPKEWSLKAIKKLKVTRVRNKLRNAHEMELPNEVANVIRNELPDKMPEIINIEGCKARFDKLASWESNQLYGGCVVTHTMRTKNRETDETQVVSAWTIYIEGIDYHEDFAHRVANTLNISMDLARRISNAWEHNIHVSLHPEVYTDVRQYAGLMAINGNFKEEDHVKDLLQGMLPFTVDYKEKLYLDLDIDQPSAVIIKGKLSVYIPPNYID